MLVNNTAVILLFGIVMCTSVYLLRLSIKSNTKKDVISYLKGYGLCLGTSIAVLIVLLVVPIGWFLYYLVIFLPFMYFAYNLTLKVIKETKLFNPIIDCIYKVIAICIIWFMAFFPLDIIAIFEVIKMLK